MNPTETGERIAALRKRKGLTQEVLAEQLNVSSKTISRWESGRSMPNYAVLEPLAKVLETDIPSLLGASQNPNPLPAPPRIKARLDEWVTPALTKKTKTSFAGLTAAYLLLRYAPTWTTMDGLLLLTLIQLVNLLFGLAGYYLLRKRALMVPVAAAISGFAFYFVADMLFGNTLASSFYTSVEFAQWNFIMVSISAMAGYIVHRWILAAAQKHLKPTAS